MTVDDVILGFVFSLNTTCTVVATFTAAAAGGVSMLRCAGLGRIAGARASAAAPTAAVLLMSFRDRVALMTRSIPGSPVALAGVAAGHERVCLSTPTTLASLPTSLSSFQTTLASALTGMPTMRGQTGS
ncbi:hypothetical protein V7x_01350 [Crateriforma conspicua]|uniref:Uncharacterized protein n=1 Tax=Crateriforma conspicua TaxID=2527996 RepID=A0A5C6FQA8_9PLAN|nr:hypothetical protein [Crateriforma conspicua]TWU64591.1 hypothetical protein V7x_01350 [Crateriforma conspicua]